MNNNNNNNNINQNIQPVCIEEDEIDLRELFATIAKHKFFIAIFVFIVTSLAILYALSKPNEYKIYTVLAPQEASKSASLGGGLASLASMAGVNIGGSSGVTPQVAFQQLLKNYTFMKSFIIKRRIDKELLNPNIQKDYIFALNYNGIYKFFHPDKEKESKKINFYSIYKSLIDKFNIATDKKTGLINVSFTHPSRKFAYYVLTSFLEEGTKFLINKNLQDINSQIEKYQKELAKTNNIELKAELAKLISSLIKQKVYINSSKYYKVKVVTDPYIPDIKDKAKPKRGLIVIVAFITSFILAIFLVFFIEFIKGSKEENLA